MHLRPRLMVSEVATASRWYQRVLGWSAAHGGDAFEMLFAGEPWSSPLVLTLARHDEAEPAWLGDPDEVRGNGVTLFWEVPDLAALEAVEQRVRADEVVAARYWSAAGRHWAVSLRDPDGYVVVVNTAYGAAEPPSRAVQRSHNSEG
jgi:catechol 2,3-dioxygenase-like lactoylglutathione lyase family enzyme